jgi:hypothetical protein
MDSRDLLILGGVAVAGYFGWRWWQSRAVTNAATDAPGTVAGRSAANMTASGASSTVFSKSVLSKNLLSPLMSVGPKLTSVTGPATAPATNEALRVSVLRAVLGPLPVAPSPNNLRFASADGTPAVQSQQPIGSPPQPGDPLPTFFSLRGIG